MDDLDRCRYHENIYPELLLPGQAASEANKKLNEKVSLVQFYFLTMTYQIHKLSKPIHLMNKQAKQTDSLIVTLKT